MPDHSGPDAVNGIAAHPTCRGCGPPTLSDYIDRGLRRSRAAAPVPLAPPCTDDAGRFARFGVQVTDGVVTAAGFRASSCATLLAYCEVAAERVSGLPLRAAIRSLQPSELASALPSVPVIKRDCAALAARALLAALLLAAKEIDR